MNVLKFVVGFAIIVLLISCEVSIWNECRETNSFLYCLKVTRK